MKVRMKKDSIITDPSNDTAVQCVLIERHIHTRREVAHRPVKMCRSSEIH